MSDPVKSVEIEDVLSSIRRLLADGEAPGAGSGARPRPEAAPEQGRELPSRGREERREDAPLMLTPALRVAGRSEAGARPAPTPFPGPSQSKPEVEDDDQDFEPTGIAAEPQPAPAPRPKLKETIAELESAVTHQDDEWEPDGSEPAPVMDWSNARAEDAPFLSRRHPARPAPKVAQPPKAPEPVAETPAVREPAPVVASAPEPQTTAAPADEMPRIDEDLLRDMIRDVLREELRGPLGDRITGNLRKLVRREIFRALASGEFD